MRRARYSRAELEEQKHAIDFFGDKLEKVPNNTRYNNFQAILYHAQGDDKKADHHYLQTINCNSHNVMARNDYAVHLAKTGRYADSVHEFHKAMLIVEDQPTLRKNVGAVLARTGEYTQALEHSRRAIQLNPSDSMSHRNIAKIYEAMGDGRSSLEHNLKSIELETSGGGKRVHTNALRAAAVQTVAKGGDRTSAYAFMDAARAYEGRVHELPTSQRTYEIIERINKRKGDVEAEMARAKEKEDKKVERLNNFKDGLMSRLDKLKSETAGKL